MLIDKTELERLEREAVERPISNRLDFQRGDGANSSPTSTPKVSLDLSSSDVETVAKQASPYAIQALLDVATGGKSESARVAAANALLDRGVGKPKQSLEVGGKLTLVQLVEQSYAPTIDITPTTVIEGDTN